MPNHLIITTRIIEFLAGVVLAALALSVLP